MPMFKKSMLVLLFFAAAMIGGTIYGMSTSDEATQLAAADLSKTNATGNEKGDAAENTSKTGKTIFVYVTGAVNKPGMVELESNEGTVRAADAVNACGGLLPTADVDNFNMAEAVSDGQHIRVPEKPSNVQTSASDNAVGTSSSNEQVFNNSKSTASINSSSKPSENSSIVNINTAGVEELSTLKGIGPKTAEKIIEYRQTNGAFKTIEEIQNVRGIGEKKFENIKSRIRV